MNTPRSQVIHLIPQPKGWRLTEPKGWRPTEPKGSRSSVANGEDHVFETIAAALLEIPGDARVHLSLPTHLLLLERMKLPSADAGELSEMARLQLEKTLSFPVNEVSSGVLIIDHADNTSEILCVVARQTALEALCAPLRSRLTVEKIAPYAARVAAACPRDETVLCIYEEQGHAVLAIADHARLSWAHAIALGDVAKLIGELPQTLLTAEMEGASVDFSKVLLGANSKSLQEALPAFEAYFEVLVESFSLEGPLPDVDIDLVPAAWRATTERHQRGARQKRVLLAVAAFYIVAIIAAFGYVALLKKRVSNVDAEIAALRPQVEALQASQARWKVMEPAIDPERATVELLYQFCKNIPKETLHLTEFDQTVVQWKVFGEAPSASLAIEYLGKLKDEKGLSAYRITASPPSLLPNEQAQFSIFGKR